MMWLGRRPLSPIGWPLVRAQVRMAAVCSRSARVPRRRRAVRAQTGAGRAAGAGDVDGKGVAELRGIVGGEIDFIPCAVEGEGHGLGGIIAGQIVNEPDNVLLRHRVRAFRCAGPPKEGTSYRTRGSTSF